MPALATLQAAALRPKGKCVKQMMGTATVMQTATTKMTAAKISAAQNVMTMTVSDIEITCIKMQYRLTCRSKDLCRCWHHTMLRGARW